MTQAVKPRFALFEAFGVELEYMLVDQDSLDVRPQVDDVLCDLHGAMTTDVSCGESSWSNELALHVIELKTTEPASALTRLPEQFAAALRNIRPTLAARGLRLLPTAMHPWMDPVQETKLWPHDYHEIYRSYDRIFDCRRHGWGNIQSVHLNLPFADDVQFGRLMAAIRLVLPLIPALAASSPVVDGRRAGWRDGRLQAYRDHCLQIPSLTGDLVPEPIYDRQTYEQQVLRPIMQAIRPHDPDGHLQESFLNARGAIARFDRGAIEIRLIDVQEYPLADIAICMAITSLLRALVAERWSSFLAQASMSTTALASELMRIGKSGEATRIENDAWLSLLGIKRRSIKAGQVWDILIDTLQEEDPDLVAFIEPLQLIREHGSLASRIEHALTDNFEHEDLRNVYRRLANCLDEQTPFIP